MLLPIVILFLSVTLFLGIIIFFLFYYQKPINHRQAEKIISSYRLKKGKIYFPNQDSPPYQQSPKTREENFLLPI